MSTSLRTFTREFKGAAVSALRRPVGPEGFFAIGIQIPHSKKDASSPVAAVPSPRSDTSGKYAARRSD